MKKSCKALCQMVDFKGPNQGAPHECLLLHFCDCASSPPKLKSSLKFGLTMAPSRSWTASIYFQIKAR